jgi:pyrrolysine biosynthesis protein PylC
MRICIVGGKLQGLEATYLSKKAGIESVLIDKDPNTPASYMADEFHCIDVLKDRIAEKILKSADGILPANEDRETLKFLEKVSERIGVPYMQDNNAFWISSDKNKSKGLFESLEIPQPKKWPECGFPVIVKPANRSGSVGIFRADNEMELREAQKAVSSIDKNVIIQKFICGKALSLELIAFGGGVVPLQTTELEFDESYGCKRVIAPYQGKELTSKEYVRVSKRVAEGLNISGLMDTQAIVNENGLPLMIEINARLPSQTPTAVYHSSGVNMVSLLMEVFTQGRLAVPSIEPSHTVIFQHVQIKGNKISVKGEHIIGEAENLRLEKNFFGLDEAITNLSEKSTSGVATLIVKDNCLKKVNERLANAIREMMSEYHLSEYDDPSPAFVVK